MAAKTEPSWHRILLTVSSTEFVRSLGRQKDINIFSYIVSKDV